MDPSVMHPQTDAQTEGGPVFSNLPWQDLDEKLTSMVSSLSAFRSALRDPATTQHRAAKRPRLDSSPGPSVPPPPASTLPATMVTSDLSESDCEEDAALEVQPRASELLDQESSSSDEEEEEESSVIRSDRIFPLESYNKVRKSILSVLDLDPSESEPSTSSSKPEIRSVLPVLTESPKGFPMPPTFQGIIKKEWASILHSKDPKLATSHLYTVSGEQTSWFLPPVVDAPVAALGSTSVLPSESEASPKHPMDRKVEASARRSFESSAAALQASMAASLANRASVLWCQRIADQVDLPKSALSDLRKIANAAAFAADATRDAVQLSARTIATSVATRRSTWLRSWEVDAAAQNRLISLPFRGARLFGEDLDPLLADSKGQGKVLPTKHRNRPFPSQRRKQLFRPFRSFPTSQPQSDFRSRQPFWKSKRFQPKSRQPSKPFPNKSSGKRQ